MRRTKRALMLALLLGLMTVIGCTSRLYSPDGMTTTVVLIRHTERTLITKELTEAGRARAAALPAALADLNIVAIYSPNLSRNIHTVKPLALARGLNITLVDAKPDAKKVVQRLLREHPGKTVLWVGNTTNLDRIYPDLGGTGEPPMKYGDLYILRVPDRGDTQIIRKHFGE